MQKQQIQVKIVGVCKRLIPSPILCIPTKSMPQSLLCAFVGNLNSFGPCYVITTLRSRNERVPMYAISYLL